MSRCWDNRYAIISWKAEGIVEFLVVGWWAVIGGSCYHEQIFFRLYDGRIEKSEKYLPSWCRNSLSIMEFRGCFLLVSWQRSVTQCCIARCSAPIFCSSCVSWVSCISFSMSGWMVVRNSWQIPLSRTILALSQARFPRRAHPGPLPVL